MVFEYSPTMYKPMSHHIRLKLRCLFQDFHYFLKSHCMIKHINLKCFLITIYLMDNAWRLCGGQLNSLSFAAAL